MMVLTDEQMEAVVDILKEEVVRRGEASFEVVSDSMGPLIKPGDKVVVKDWPVEELRRGDILLYQNQHTLYSHRLLYKRAGGNGIMLITKGDASKSIDSPFLQEHFLGRVVGIQKRHRKINLQTRWWQLVNWLLAGISLIEARLFSAGEVQSKENLVGGHYRHR